MNLSVLATNKFLNIYYSLNTVVDNYKTKKFTETKIENSFGGGFVIVIALFEKTSLRKDVIKFLETAKEIGAFIIGVNTLSLKKQSYENGLFDVYIERDNFGRDFGSYQAGFNYIFDNEINIKCDRVMMINDSVYFSLKGLSEFVTLMSSTENDVLGATENHHDIHHLGSFCISFSKKVVSNQKFISFWRNYRRTNVRPKIIKKGEMALTSMLRSINEENGYLPVAYSVTKLEKLLQNDDFLKSYVSKIRWGDERVVISKSLSDCLFANKSAKDFYLRNFEEVTKPNEESTIDDASNKNIKTDNLMDFVHNDVGLISFVRNIDFNATESSRAFKSSLIACCINLYSDSSQIHSNCISLYSMGLPIIKMDLIYRSLASYADVERIKSMLPDEEKDDFFFRLTNKGSGLSSHKGIKLTSFMHGFI